MTKFSYFHVFESILYGLMLAKWLLDTNNLYTFRAKIKFYWPHTLQVFIILATIVNNYHFNLDSPVYDAVDGDNGEWYFLHVIVIPPLLLYSVVHQLFPSHYDQVDFKSYFLVENRKIIFVLGALTHAFGIYRFCIHHSLRTGLSPWEIYLKTLGDLWFYMPHLGVVLSFVVAFWKNESFLKVIIILSLTATVFVYLV